MRITKDGTAGGNRERYDLEERTATFGERVIAMAKAIRPTPITKDMITQLVNAGTSVGANYCEANNAESKKDFRHKIGICRKESREARFWIRQVCAAQDDLRELSRGLDQEARELNLIFSAILRRIDKGAPKSTAPVS